MSRVFWDTNLFIYLLEDLGPQSARVAEVRERMLERDDELFTSTLTLGEVLVKPAERGNEGLRQRYEDALAHTARLIAFDRETARRYAEIRRNRSIRPPDAIQLACAAHVGVDLFITNDDRLSRLTITGIQFLVPLERAFLQVDTQELLDELVHAARRLGVEVRSEPFETPAALGGGLCVVRGAHLVLIDQRAPLADRLRALARAVGDLESEAVYMAPEARELVDGLRPARRLTQSG